MVILTPQPMRMVNDCPFPFELRTEWPGAKCNHWGLYDSASQICRVQEGDYPTEDG
jgi:hypothetical protein